MNVLRDLIGSIRMPLQKDHLNRLQVIENTDYSNVVRKTREHFEYISMPTSEEYLQEGVFALKQYYAIALLDPANAHAVSTAVDPFWHAHILHTQEYMQFCNQVVGEYMHHQPLDRRNKLQLENVRVLYGYTLEVLEHLFYHVNREFWSPNMTDAAMICFHKGNQEIYTSVQSIRLFEPTSRGESKAFSV